MLAQNRIGLVRPAPGARRTLLARRQVVIHEAGRAKVHLALVLVHVVVIVVVATARRAMAASSTTHTASFTARARTAITTVMSAIHLVCERQIGRARQLLLQTPLLCGGCLLLARGGGLRELQRKKQASTKMKIG
jgi:hypothetical protein